MNILVCISKTPDTTAKIAFQDDNTQFDTNGVQFIMNPYDEWYALVKGLEVKEKHGGKVTVIHVGPSENETIIRKALAIGADEAVRIDHTPASARDVATQIAHYVNKQSFDIILTGKETIDYNGSQMGAMLSALLDLHFVSYASHMEISEGEATVTRDIEGGTETIKLSLPLVVSGAKGLAEQRIPNMRGIMMAKRKPLAVEDKVASDEKSSITEYALPPKRTSCTYVDPEEMDKLVKLLHEEAKVI